jgi:hypothetical protein
MNARNLIEAESPKQYVLRVSRSNTLEALLDRAGFHEVPGPSSVSPHEHNWTRDRDYPGVGRWVTRVSVDKRASSTPHYYRVTVWLSDRQTNTPIHIGSPGTFDRSCYSAMQAVLAKVERYAPTIQDHVTAKTAARSFRRVLSVLGRALYATYRDALGHLR